MINSQRFSQSFWNPLRQAKADNLSHNLMLRADLINALDKGIYAWQPMGVKVLRKIENIIHKHMNKAGFEELLIPVVQPAVLWKKSGRYDAYGEEMLRMHDRHNHELIYGPTAEECVSEVFDRAKLSYANLPVRLYNIQWKFRDEIRPRFGVLRSREFLMKDAYSFDLDETAARQTYELMFNTYIDIFHDMGLKVLPVQAVGGAVGGSVTHEFQVLAQNGENTLFFDAELNQAERPRLADMDNIYSRSQDNHVELERVVQTSKGIEVGQIFLLGDKYTKAMDITVATQTARVHPMMGCYGIGVTRLVGAIIESSNDEKGIIWPKAVAPYDVHLVNLNQTCEECVAYCEKIYIKAQQDGISVFYDDTNDSAGSKLANADLLGLPEQWIVGKKEMREGNVSRKIRGSGVRDSIVVV